ncbi:MAG: hypothetical protein FD130_500 [Halothiobacillaceae bacterium]|nr:MAG: hypothetical protein FD130_500 [Halothiobacillaceae bacterium]
MRIYMQSPVLDGRAPRFFQLLLQKDLLEGWLLVSETGQQGQRGRVKQIYFQTREEAEAELLKLRDEQLAKGFRVVFLQGAVDGR